MHACTSTSILSYHRPFCSNVTNGIIDTCRMQVHIYCINTLGLCIQHVVLIIKNNTLKYTKYMQRI